RIDGAVQFLRDAGTINLGVVSDVIVLGPMARVMIDTGHFFQLSGDQVFVQGRIAGGDFSEVDVRANATSGVCVLGGLIRVGAESRLDVECGSDVFLQAASDLRFGPDGEVDAGAARVVMAGRMRGRGKPGVGAGMQLFVRTLQLLGPDGKVKARG